MGEKTNNKTSALKSLLLRAWRERWSDVQWSISVKRLLSPKASENQHLVGTILLTWCRSPALHLFSSQWRRTMAKVGFRRETPMSCMTLTRCCIPHSSCHKLTRFYWKVRSSIMLIGRPRTKMTHSDLLVTGSMGSGQSADQVVISLSHSGTDRSGHASFSERQCAAR